MFLTSLLVFVVLNVESLKYGFTLDIFSYSKKLDEKVIEDEVRGDELNIVIILSRYNFQLK